MELFVAFLGEAVSVGLISHGHPVYIYDPFVQCNISTSADVKNTTSDSDCHTRAGIAVIVVLALICIIPIAWSFAVSVSRFLLIALASLDALIILLTLTSFCNYTDYSEKHSSPMSAFLNNVELVVKKRKGKENCKTSVDQSPKAIVTSQSSFLVFILKNLAIPIYLFGKFLEPILHKYGKCLSCDYDCVVTWGHVSTAALFLSSVMFHGFPHLVKNIAQYQNWKYEPSKAYRTLGVFSVLLKAQSTYSFIFKLFRSNSYCSESEQAWGWIFLLLTSATATIFVTVKLCQQFFITGSSGECSKKRCGKLALLIIILFIFICITFIVILLSNNLQPLDYAFHCDILPKTTSHYQSQMDLFIQTEHCCEVKENVITRLSVIAFSIMLFAIFSVLVLFAATKEQNKISPQQKE